MPKRRSSADRIRAYFAGSEALLTGGAPKIDELTVAWALEAPQVAPNVTPRVVADVGALNLPMVRVGTSGVFAAVANLSHGAAMTWHYEVGPDRRLGGSQLEVYADPSRQPRAARRAQGHAHADAVVEEQDLRGHHPRLVGLRPGAVPGRRTPPAVMVFQDGAGPKDYVPTVFDNLIAKGDMPVTVGIFINPGIRATASANRSFEYDTLSDQYARFLLEEILPEVEKTVKLRHDAASRAIAGASSGGICAFTVAWERPDEFSKVLSWVGSFTNIASGKTLREGGHNYEALIRKTSDEADPRLPAGRRQRPRQRQRQLAAGQPADGEVARLRRLRLQVRLRPGLPQQPARPRDPARLAAVALAGLQALICAGGRGSWFVTSRRAVTASLRVIICCLHWSASTSIARRRSLATRHRVAGIYSCCQAWSCR